MPQGSSFLVNTYTTGHQQFSSVAMDSAGDLVVAWESGSFHCNSASEDGDGNGIFAKQYPVYNPPVVTTTASA